jgi:predicted GH43/DUF377 family glycosyl hydrolase
MFTVKREPENPLISPVTDHGWEEVATCNGCPVQDGDTMHMLYRAMEKPDRLRAAGLHRSVVGYAKSTDGVEFTGRRPLIIPTEEWDMYGCEDPRITKLEDTFYIFYTGLSNFPLNAEGIKIGVALSKDCETITEKHLVTPFNAKAMAMFPERINGKIYTILTPNTDRPPAEVAIAAFDSPEQMWDQDYWHEWYTNLPDHALPLRRHDSEQVEVGAPPVKTDKGWLVVYSHIQNYYSDNKIFGIEAVLLDLKDPTKIIGRTDFPFMVPETSYEHYGLVPNVVFPTGAIVRDDGKYLDVYYGAADTTCCKATISLPHLLHEMLPETRMTDVVRVSRDPILSPTDNDWEKRLVFNPAAIELEGNIYILYRAHSSDNTSSFGLAISKDGTTIDERLPEPVYVPREDFEMKKGSGYSGCEDPRLTLIDDVLYVCYTAYDGINVPRVAVSSILVKDFLARKWKKWKKPVLLTPRSIDDKDACILPDKMFDKYMVIHRIQAHICGDSIESLHFETEQVDTCIEILEPRLGMWDSKRIGIAGTPHKTDKGWLMLYHGVSEDNVYRVGVALLKEDDITTVIARSDHAILEPVEQWEREGEVPNVVFPCGSVIRDDTIFIYYGGADKELGIATLSLSKTLEALTLLEDHE